MKKDTISFMKRCRLCGRCHQGSLDIFSSKEKNLKELIRRCLDINVREDDSLPKKLCQCCEKKLSLWEKFKKSSDEVQVKLIADSLPNELNFPSEKEGNTLGDEVGKTSPIPSKNLACNKSIESFKTKRKRKSRSYSTKGFTLSFPLEKLDGSKGNDAGIRSTSKKPDETKKSYSKKNLSCDSILSNQVTKLNHKGVSSADLNSDVSKSEEPCHVTKEELKTKECIAKSSKLTGQNMCDLNDTLSKNEIAERYAPSCAQISDSVNKTDKELTKPSVTEKQSCVSSDMKCSEFIPSRKTKINLKSNETEEKKNATMSPMKELQCPLCPRKLSTTYNLKHHLETHSEKCNYCCHLCGKLFRTRSSLSNHVRVHLLDDTENQEGNREFSGKDSSVRIFQCEICDKKFRQSGHLSYHLKMHTGMRSHSCSVCGKSFTEKYQLRRHENAVHNKIKRYTCEVCGKQFLHTHNFKDHKLQHEGIAKISCDLCGKTFLTSNALSRHQRLHTGVKPFACDICGKKFRDCSNRKRHRDKHSEEEKKGLLTVKEESSEASILAPVEEIVEVTEGEWESKVKKTYMNLKTYFESNDDVSMKEELNSGNPELLQSISNDSSNPGPLLDCGLFGEEIDLNSDGLLLIGDGRIGSGMIGGSDSHKDQLVWVPSCDLLPRRDECLNNICGDEDDLRSGDVVLGGGDIGIQMGLCGMQAGDITGILEVGMGLCSDFDVGTGIDLGKDGLSNDFQSINDMKEGEKAFDNVLHLQVF